MSSLIYFVILLKFLVPTFMLRVPFVGAWGNYLLDIVDGDILMALGLSDYVYQTIDKAADYYSYVIMLILGLSWRIRKLMILLFLYRTIGQVLFFLTRNEQVFFYFQNLLEPLVMAYTLLLVLSKGNEAKAYAAYKKHLLLIWVIIILYKVWNEWYLHLANIDLSTLFFGFNGGMEQ